jgi:hypothetical protein
MAGSPKPASTKCFVSFSSSILTINTMWLATLMNPSRALNTFNLLMKTTRLYQTEPSMHTRFHERIRVCHSRWWKIAGETFEKSHRENLCTSLVMLLIMAVASWMYLMVFSLSMWNRLGSIVDQYCRSVDHQLCWKLFVAVGTHCYTDTHEHDCFK